MEKVIEVKNLIKKYTIKSKEKGIFSSKNINTINAINNISFNVTRGEKVGYVGLNGAGKSTTVKLLTGLISPTKGEVSVLGFDPFLKRKKYVQYIGAVFGQRNQLFWDLDVRDSFLFNKELYGISQNKYLERLKLYNQFLDLESLMNRKVLTLSLGQKMRVNVAISMLHSPDLLFLDEPTIGVDIVVKDQIKDLLNELNRREGTTIMFTSHDMKDIENICDRIIVLNKGKILEDLSIENFNKKYGGRKKLSFNYSQRLNSENIYGLLQETFSNQILNFSIDKEKRLISLYFKDDKISLIKILQELEELGVDMFNMRINSDNLEEAIRNIYQINSNDS